MKRIIKCSFFVLSLFFYTFSVASEIEGHLVDYGLIEYSDAKKRYAVPDQPGRYSINAKLQVVDTTDTIPLEKGVAFGIVWAIFGISENEVQVVYSVEHPEMLTEDGSKSRLLQETMTHTVAGGVAKSIDGYILRHDYELLPGPWTVSIEYGDTRISKTFTVE